MVQKGKINVKERFSDGEVDLSMSDLDEVPVKEIVALKKTTSLDLSNNRLTLLPKDFAVLINLTKLDLSKNELTELPEDFGSLSKLKYLDLYKNNLERLPLSFGQLNGLKFLDLKDNPLIPAIAKVAGPCVDTKGCQQCARDVVNFFRKLQEEVDNQVEMRKKARQKQVELNQQKKQAEKKKQKKEKQNNKPKKDIEKNDNKQVTTGKKQIKKEQKKNKTPKETSNAQGTVLLSVVIILFSVFYLFNYRYSLIEPYIRFNKSVYKEFLNKIPNNAKYYVETFVNSLDSIMERINKAILNYIQVLTNNEIIQAIIVKLREGVGGIVEKVVGKKE